MKKAFKRIWHDEGGDAVVEATFLFPIIIIIFFIFVLLAMYLPTSVALQRSVQKAAHILSAQQSDLGYVYDYTKDQAGIDLDRLRRENVYVVMLSSASIDSDTAVEVVKKYAADALITGSEVAVTVARDTYDDRYMVITAEQTLEMPFAFSFIPMSNEIVIQKSARALSRDTDEFVRSMDIVYDLVIKQADAVKDTLGDLSNFLDVFDRIKAFFNL